MTTTQTHPFSTPSTNALAAAVIHGNDRLAEARVGLVTTLHRKVSEPDEPRDLASFHGRVGAARPFGGWHADRISLSMLSHNEVAARRAASGEAVDRYRGHFIPRDRLVEATWNELQARGEQAVDPEALPRYSERRMERESRIRWAPGLDLLEGGTAWAPASLVYPNGLASTRVRQRPKHHFINISGPVAGIGREPAERAALDTVTERDAVSIWYVWRHVAEEPEAIRRRLLDLVLRHTADPQALTLSDQLLFVGYNGRPIDEDSP